MIGGLIRLFAEHLSLEFHARVFLWFANRYPRPSREALVRRDLAQLGGMVDRLAGQIEAEGAPAPISAPDLLKLSSEWPPPGVSPKGCRFGALALGHSQIVADIAFLEAVGDTRSSPKICDLLTDLSAQHREMRKAYAAEGIHET